MRWPRSFRRPRWTIRRIMAAVVVAAVVARLGVVAYEVDAGMDYEYEVTYVWEPTGEILPFEDPRVARNLSTLSFLHQPGPFWPRFGRRALGMLAEKVPIRLAVPIGPADPPTPDMMSPPDPSGRPDPTPPQESR